MQQTRKMIALLLMIVPAAQAVAADDPATLLAPYVDAHTMAVARIDLQKIQPMELTDLMVKLTSDAGDKTAVRQEFAMGAIAFEGVKAAWSAAGGQEIYAVATLADLTPAPVFFVAPLAPTHDPQAVEILAKQFLPEASGVFQVQVIDGTAVAASAKTLARLKAKSPVTLPDLRDALAKTDGAAVQAALRLSNDTRRVIQEMTPTLPKELSGGSTALISRGFQWAAVSLDFPPTMHLDVHIQSADAASAQSLQESIVMALSALGRQTEKDLQINSWKMIEEALTPKIEGASLRLALDHTAVEALLAQAVGPALKKARHSTRRTQTIYHLRQLILACHQYAGNEKNKDALFPPDLATLVELNQIRPESVLSPFAKQKVPADFAGWPADQRRTWVNDNASYVLLPGLNAKDFKAEQIALFEKVQFSRDDRVILAFCDGHAEVRAHDAAQEAVVKQTGKTLEQWSGQPAR